ncbi:MAG: Flp pilus assembly protein CpaB [Phycisphaerales bacterium]|nr:MAG: Flp pilus assembly protein CpaB [Phycisphaerales bacterium]
MFKAKSIVPLLVGLGVGFYAVKLGVDMVKRAQGSGSGGPGTSIVVTTLEAPVGTELTAEMLKVVDVPQVLAPARAFNDPEEVVGRVISHSLLPGGYICEDVLAPPGTPPGLDVKIPEGYRAVAVKVDEYSSVAGFLMPGSRVDVIAVMSTNSSRGRDTVSRTILEDIAVAAVGQQMADPKDPTANITRSVTLLVKPKAAALLHLADTKGRIRLALRQQKDAKSGQRGFASETDLSDPSVDPNPQGSAKDWWRGLASGFASRAAERPGTQAPEVRVAVAPTRPWVVTVINGSRTEQVVFASALSSRPIHLSSGENRGLLNSGQKMGRYSDRRGARYAESEQSSEQVSEEPEWAGLPDD